MTDLEWEKQKEAAKTAPILDVANMTGLTIVKRGRYYTSKEHDSLVIDTKKNFFYHNSQHVNGDTIAMLQHFNGLSYQKAVKAINNRFGANCNQMNYRNSRNLSTESDALNTEFRLPKIAVNLNGEIHTKPIEEYLVNVRCISSSVVKYMISSGRLYQQSMREKKFTRGRFKSCCVFVGFPTGKNDCVPSFCERRTIFPAKGKRKTMTVPNSDWEHGFYINNDRDTLIVTEGILDSMAIMTILDQKGLDFKCYDYLSLIGTNKTECVATILEEQSHIKTVILSLDNDDAGRKATEVTIDKAAPFEADRYYVVIYGAVVTAAAVILARLDLRRDAVLALAVVPVLAAHFVHPNEYLYEQYAPRTEALAKTAALPAVVLNNAGYDVAPDLFVTEFAAREAVYQAGAGDDAASLQAAAQSRDLQDGFVVYGYVYDADALKTMIEDTLDTESVELLTDVAKCPVYYVKLK